MRRYIGIDFGTRYTYIYGGCAKDDGTFVFIDLINVLKTESALQYAAVTGKGIPTVIGKSIENGNSKWKIGADATATLEESSKIYLETELKKVFREGSIYDKNNQKIKSKSITDATYYDLAVKFFEMILDALKKTLSGRGFINNDELEYIYLGHPDDTGYTYGREVKNVLIEAFRHCGCDVESKIIVKAEACLSGYSYCLAKGMDNTEQYIGVIDCGGGTTDFAILHWSSEEKRLESKITSHGQNANDKEYGSQYPAGDNFDQKLLSQIKDYCRKKGVDTVLSDELLLFSIRAIKEGFYPHDYTQNACQNADERKKVNLSIQTTDHNFIPIIFNRDAMPRDVHIPDGAIEFDSDGLQEDQKSIAAQATEFFERNLIKNEQEIFPANTKLSKLLFVGGTSLMWEIRNYVAIGLTQSGVFDRGEDDSNIWFIGDERSGPSANSDKPRVGNAVALGGCYLAKSKFISSIPEGTQPPPPLGDDPPDSTEYLAIHPCIGQYHLNLQRDRVLFRSGERKTFNGAIHIEPYTIPENGRFTFYLVRTNNGARTKNVHYTFTGQSGEKVYFIAIFDKEQGYQVYGMTQTELINQFNPNSQKIALIEKRDGSEGPKRHWSPT